MDNTGKQPALSQKQMDVIREGAVKAEKDGKPVKGQVAILQEYNLLNMLAPQTSGGLQLSVPEALQQVEDLSATDGSIGWLTANGAMGSWTRGVMNEDIFKELNNGKSYIATSAAINGTAEKTKSGYTITGRWSYVAGAVDATAFVANCKSTDKDAANNGQVMSILLLKNELNLSACNPMGLTGAGMMDVEVKNLKIPANRVFAINADNATNNARLYQYPYVQLYEAMQSIAVAGMAGRFTELAKAMISEMKDSSGAALTEDIMVQDTLTKYVQKMNDARVKLYYSADLTWQACSNQQPIKDTILYKVSAAAQDLTRKARECADALYPFCGIAAMDRSAEINRVWRDLHTASQERLIVFGGL